MTCKMQICGKLLHALAMLGFHIRGTKWAVYGNWKSRPRLTFSLCCLSTTGAYVHCKDL